MIATILMVAITVVLAAVLYVMVSGLIVPPGQGPRAIGVVVDKTGDGSNWQLTVASVPAGMPLSSVYLTVFYGNGTVAQTKTALDSLSGNAQLVQGDASSTTLRPGDRILLSTTAYPAGSSYQLAEDAGILAEGTLR